MPIVRTQRRELAETDVTKATVPHLLYLATSGTYLTKGFYLLLFAALQEDNKLY